MVRRDAIAAQKLKLKEGMLALEKARTNRSLDKDSLRAQSLALKKAKEDAKKQEKEDAKSELILSLNLASDVAKPVKEF